MCQALARAFFHHGLPAPLPADLLAQALPTWRSFPEVPHVLQRLKASGYRLAILSNVGRDPIQPSLAQLPVRFDVVVTAGLHYDIPTAKGRSGDAKN